MSIAQLQHTGDVQDYGGKDDGSDIGGDPQCSGEVAIQIKQIADHHPQNRRRCGRLDEHNSQQVMIRHLPVTEYKGQTETDGG